ncbi:hypothetical protein ACLI4U_12265 [Natrialbaceae archaeon A-CW2]
MVPSPPTDSQSGRSQRQSGDQYGFSETKNYLSALLEPLVPQRIAVPSLGVSVKTDKTTYDLGEPVIIDIVFKNRLPVPISIETPTARLWGWSVDGELAASDESEYRRNHPNTFSFRAGETKRIQRIWDGQFKRNKRNGDPTKWIPAPSGEYEITAFVDARYGRSRPSASTTIILE